MILENQVIYNMHMFFMLAAFSQMAGLFAYGMGLFGARLCPGGQRRFCRRLGQSISLLLLVAGSAFMLFFAFRERDATLFLGQLAFLLAALLVTWPRRKHAAPRGPGQYAWAQHAWGQKAGQNTAQAPIRMPGHMAGDMAGNMAGPVSCSMPGPVSSPMSRMLPQTQKTA